MKFRFTAFALHLLASAAVLAVLLGVLYFGWYRWPGWYLTGMLHIVVILGGVDLTLGPLFTLLIANPNKPRRELARDVAVIVAVQLVALGYGASTLWQGRPLYYTYSVDRMEMVPATEVPPEEVALAWKNNPQLAPHWYSRPRWVWAPPPPTEEKAERLKAEAARGGSDIIQMPEYFRPWSEGRPYLREHLQKVDQLLMFSWAEQRKLKKLMTERGYVVDKPSVLFLTGHDRPLLVVFDPQSLEIKAFIRADS